MKQKNKSPFKCLVSVGGCRYQLTVMHMCCGGNHEPGPVTHHVLCPDPPMSVSAVGIYLIWRVLLCGGGLFSESFFCLFSGDAPHFP